MEDAVAFGPRPQTFDFAGMASAIFGGGSGLGAATARLLAEAGAAVTVIDANAEAAARAAEGLGAASAACDVTDAAAVEVLWAGPLREPMVPRLVVNCAGIAPAKRLHGRAGAQPLDAFRKVIEVNLVGSFNVLRTAAAAMTRNEPDADGCRGTIILTASIAAWEGQIGQAAYAASKAGVVGLILPAARELALHGIRVMGIAPGVFETPMVGDMPREVRESLYETVPFPHRFGRPEEFARLVASIQSNPMLNGTTIRLDGANRMAAQ